MNVSIETLRRIKNKYEKEWLNIPGVQAIGIGMNKQGEQSIVVTVSKLDEKLKKRFPAEVEGVPVELREGGPFSAL